MSLGGKKNALFSFFFSYFCWFININIFLRNYFIVCGTHFEVHGAPSVYASSPCVSCEMVQQQNRTLFVFWTEEYYGKKRVK